MRHWRADTISASLPSNDVSGAGVSVPIFCGGGSGGVGDREGSRDAYGQADRGGGDYPANRVHYTRYLVHVYRR